MKKLLTIIPLVILLCFTFGYQQGEEVAKEPAVDIEADKTAIESVREKELRAFDLGDVEGLDNIVTEDIVIDTPNRPAIVGKEAHRAFCEALFSRLDYEATYSVDELVIEKNWAFDRGVWIEKRVPKVGGEQSQLSFGILQLYKRQSDGSWKLARLIWNSKGPHPTSQEKEQN
jgi:ketosteroid isomerase-like protein